MYKPNRSSDSKVLVVGTGDEVLLRLFGQIHEKILEKTLKIHHLDPNSMWLLFRVDLL